MKKILFRLMVIIPMALIAISCDSDDGQPHQHVNPYDQFKGTWAGTFSGEDSGTWSATIDKDGKAAGTISSNGNSSLTFQLSGTLSENGSINMTYTYNGQQVGTMTGTMTTASASGIWESPLQDKSGTWAGTKK